MPLLEIPTALKKSRELSKIQSEQLGAHNKYIQLSIDPGSTNMGVAFWDMEGHYLSSTAFRTDPNQSAAQRLYSIRQQFCMTFDMLYPDKIISNTVMELLPPSQICPSLPISPGIIIAHERNISRLLPISAVPVNTWKSVAKQLGYPKNDPKGVDIFKNIPWDYPMPKTEDEADAIIIMLAFFWEQRGLVWLGPDLRVRRMKRVNKE